MNPTRFEPDTRRHSRRIFHASSPVLASNTGYTVSYGEQGRQPHPKASIRNRSQFGDDLDALGFSWSKLWNVGLWTIHRVWDEPSYIPEHDELISYLKTHERYDDLYSQSSQRLLQELTEAFHSWYGKRLSEDTRANPPGYQKHTNKHPRSTTTFKDAGFKPDTAHNCVRLSQGQNTKDYWSEFILCECQIRPGLNLSTVEHV